jgi:hypothetical protein
MRPGGRGLHPADGAPALRGATAARAMLAHVRREVVPPSRLRGDLERVVFCCLEKDFDARFPGAESLEAALSACATANDWGERKAARRWLDFGGDAPGSGFDELAG